LIRATQAGNAARLLSAKIRQRIVVLKAVAACTGDPWMQRRAASISASEAPWLRAHISAVAAEYFAT
jgi:hypothetical protein